MRDLIGKDARNAAFDQLLGVLGEQILDDCFLATFGVDLRKLYELSDKVIFDFFIFKRFGGFCLIVDDFHAVFS